VFAAKAGFVGGRINKTNNSYDINYFITDHLGSTRVIVDNAGNIKEQKDYYPFGKEHENANLMSSTNRWNFNGKEKQTVYGLNYLDYGARMMDVEIGRWFVIDPLAEKYYSISPYAYCMNNPLKYVDPTGMIIEDPDEIYKKHKEQMNDQLAYIREALKAEGLSDVMSKALGQLENSYQSVLKEYSTLEKSDQVYKVFNSGEDGVYFDKGTVMIGIGDASLGLVGHELKHAYQYEKGEISFRLDGSGFGVLYDIYDETAAYNRERMLNSGLMFFIDPNIKWGNSDVRSFGKAMVPPAYESLPEGPININSKIGKALRNSTINSGVNRVSPSDVYKGYDIDFNKGWKKSRQ
jgi:RHS repeat-associated protein